VGIRAILEPRGGKLRPAELRDGERAINRRRTKRVLPEGTAAAVQTMLQGVVRIGSGKRASLGPDIMVAGKTGTTENYGDAWFVGWTPRYTVAVWVGFPDELKPMEPPTFSFNGEPVAGGTYPAAIWGTFMRQAMAIYEGRNPGSAEELQPDAAPTPGATAPQGSADGAPVPTAPPSETPPPSTQQNPATTAPEQPTPAPTQAPPSGGGTGGGGTGGGGTGGAPSTGAGGATPPEPGADAATGQSTD
jgi:penicillin-binding protein 1A